MEKAGKQSTSDKVEDQEKYARNQMKYDASKIKFEELTNSVNEKLLKVENKIELVTLDLTLKFTKTIQLDFYREMNQVFFRLKNIEGEMIETAHQELLLE